MTTNDPHIYSHAVVLAAGDGFRLSGLTTTSTGVAVPKQYCSMWGGSSLLEDALLRAERVVSPKRVSVVVAAQHRRWWDPALRGFRPARSIVQPQNLGTGVGVLLALLHLERREPSARVLLIPSDHHVRNEALLASALREADAHVAANPSQVVLLGLQPDEPDTQLGYIVPVPSLGSVRINAVHEFVEKPDHAIACELMQRGALWNSFLLCGRVSTLMAWYVQVAPQLVASLRDAIARDAADSTVGAVAALYRQLAPLDFSRDLLRGREGQLRVLAVRDCGWSDLGTADSVAKVFRQHPGRTLRPAPSTFVPSVVLAAQQVQRPGLALH